MTTVLIAPDKFKGSLGAADVARALARGIGATCPEADLALLPIADGGDGTVEAAIAAGFEERTDTVTGPTGAPLDARWALHGTEAVLELAETSGLGRLPDGRLDHDRASTRGLGELVLAARDAGATDLLIGLGGSASTDGGAGLLAALGARLLDQAGAPIADGHGALADLASIDLAPARDALAGLRLRAACDVTSPLLGPDGAAAVFGPQKGLAAEDLPVAEARLARLADLADPRGELRERPGAGAAGGTGFALYLLGAGFASGADAVLDLLGFDAALSRADLVITGEGKLDAQTLQGKGPAEVARRAAARGIDVIAVAGTDDLETGERERAGIGRVLDLVSRARDVADAIARPAALLEGVGREIGAQIAAQTAER